MIRTHFKANFRTTVNDGHMHLWMPGQRFTTVNDGHNHRVFAGVALPNKPGAHSHMIFLFLRKVSLFLEEEERKQEISERNGGNKNGNDTEAKFILCSNK